MQVLVIMHAKRLERADEARLDRRPCRPSASGGVGLEINATGIGDGRNADLPLGLGKGGQLLDEHDPARTRRSRCPP